MPQKSLKSPRSSGGRLVSVDGVDLPLRRVELRAEAQGGLARTVLRQVFSNVHDEPLQVHYSVPLPAEAAVSGYEISIGPRVIRGRVEPREDARQEFERALIEGRTGGLLDQERTSVFTLELGNVPPHLDVVVELTVDHRLAWLPDGMWEWRFPTVIAPRYMGNLGRVGDADRVHMDVAEASTPVHATLDLRLGDERTGAPVSPSHSIRAEGPNVALACAGTELDRDVVVRWPVARSEPGLAVRCGRSAAGSELGDRTHALLTIVPPAAGSPSLQRDLVLLLDCSGSMAGQALDLAKQIATALVESLDDSDTLEIISFSTGVRRWQKKPERTTRSQREDARRWIHTLAAGGGTEMLDAVETALRPLREGAQRQVVLVTDGQVGFESEVMRAVRHRLPRGSRLHTVGIGSAVNRTLTTTAARAGRGTEIIVGLAEDSLGAVERLLAALRSPIVTDLDIAGSAVRACSPGRLPDLMAGAPVLVALELDPGGGEIAVRGLTASGVWQEQLHVAASEPGSGDGAIGALFARELVEDLEMERAIEGDPKRIDDEIRRLGLEFGIATRLTSWVAVSEEPDVDPRQPVRSERMPQMLPYGMSAEGLGLRSPRAGFGGSGARRSCDTLEMMPLEASRVQRMPPAAAEPRFSLRGLGALGALGRLRAGTKNRRPGRWVRIGPDGPQVLEFVATGSGLSWDPGASVTVVLRGGRRKQVAVVERVTTRPGRIEPRQSVRIGLDLGPDEVLEVEEVEVQCGTAMLRVFLQ